MTESKIQMDQIRSTSATVTDENIRAGSQKKSSLSPAEGLQGASPDATCTCPSGDGYLVHPCPAHPAPVEQAGGDERAAFRPAQVISYRPGMGEVTIYVAGRVPGYMNIGDTVYVSDRAPVEQPSAALAQPSPAQAEVERPEVVGYLSITGARLLREWGVTSIRREEFTPEACEPLMTVAQHERIVGELRAVIAQLRQHKNDYMDSGQETYRALLNEIREREAEIARLDGLVSGRTAERDAALARVAELERQEPVALANRGLHAFWVKWTEAAAGLYGPGIKLYAAPVVQAQHSVPKEFIGRLSEFLAQRGATGKALLRELRALCAAAPGKEVGHE
ncbi:TPA: hypothetical protein ACRL37_001309 [Pseudomonas aeruginosa]|nr:Uncharacterised protein [Acinetobacter baumannii]